MKVQMIAVHVDVPEAAYSKVRFAWNFFAQSAGIKIKLIFGKIPDNARVCYGSDVKNRLGQVYLPFHAEYYDPKSMGFIGDEIDDVITWRSKKRVKHETDFLGSIYRVLNMLDEGEVADADRDTRGIFQVSALPKDRYKWIQEPLADNAVHLLKQLLLRACLPAAGIPKWPNGKRYGVLLTHDTDAVALGHWREMLYNAVKLGMGRQSAHRFQMLWDGSKSFFGKGKDDFNTFSLWDDFESKLDLRSCFFLFAKSPKARFRLYDCRSSVLDRSFDLDPIRRMHDRGWEFGFHAPLDACGNVDAFIWGKLQLEDKLGFPIYGLRHHYWNLDWRFPYHTFRKQINAGFRYDMSLAWRDSVGFRAGTSMPHNPYDPLRSKALNLYQIPSTVMDGHILSHGRARQVSSKNCSKEVLAKVRYHGGVFVLDWHTETGCNKYIYDGYLDQLDETMMEVVGSSDAWVTTPWQLVKHWHERVMLLES